MTPNQACEYCGAPLAPNASACDACGQPRRTQGQPPGEVPGSYIEPPQPEPPSPPPVEPPDQSPPAEVYPSQPAIPSGEAPQRQNNCLRYGIVAALLLAVLCCCALIALVVIASNIDLDSLVGFGMEIATRNKPA